MRGPCPSAAVEGIGRLPSTPQSKVTTASQKRKAATSFLSAPTSRGNHNEMPRNTLQHISASREIVYKLLLPRDRPRRKAC
jgi:hypothetical protein